MVKPQKQKPQSQKPQAVRRSGHKLSLYNKIVVLDHGKIVEVGNHSDLLKFGGMYNEMIENQKFAGE